MIKPRHRVILSTDGVRWKVMCRAPGTGKCSGWYVWFVGFGSTQHEAWADLMRRRDERARALAADPVA